ncbi:hypothetical protein F4677DRAFT_464703 [Hypoxylon crocopeplum]|nr:hypothetical protein F4677DRAFT_464703 [Hypoxylon crocopeplum]
MASDAESIEYTISQDRAAGHSAQEESGYQLLTKKEPSSEVPETNISLQDYQLQLMLLEQQNKKRLLMARQEQSAMEGPYNAFKELAQTADSKKRERAEFRRNLEDNLEYDHGNDEESEEVDELDRSTDLHPEPHPKRMKTSHRDTRSSQSTPKLIENYASTGRGQDRNTKSASSSISHTPAQGGLDKDHQGDDDTLTGQRDADPMTYGFYILYRVACSDRHPLCHRRIYLDEPRRIGIKGVYHLSGDNLVPDLDDFLRDQQHTAFVVYRDYYCEKGTISSWLGSTGNRSGVKYLRELFSIVSEDLHSIIQRISKFAPNDGAYHISVSNLSSPALSTAPSEYSHQFIYHHREELRLEAAAALENSDVALLSSYILNNPDSTYKKCDELFSQGLVSHDTLQWLFRPNDVLVSSEGPLQIAYVLRTFPAESSRLELSCWNWGYNGHWLRRKDTTLTVSLQTYDTVRIDSLAVYPLRYAGDETKKKLLDNGDKFWDMRQQTFVSYEGPDYKGEHIYPSDSRCMIDYQVYFKFHSNSDAFVFSKNSKATYDPWPDSIPITATLPQSLKMLLPPGVHGFFVKEKKWVHLLVDNIRPVSWNTAAFDRLVLPKRTKNLIKALVMVRNPKSESRANQIGMKWNRDDIIAGKGKGLIMLLHGGPGTGKTLTAESVAELAQMPLYSVTCGDIGTSPEAVEKYLNSVLHLGKKWNCVLLLDEADVFLEERSLSDLERNSLVSVFLRTLEYYDGVLILTSNRVGTFDEAFKSRIQLALHYPSLDAPSRRKIWHNFLDMLRADNEDVDFDDIIAHMDKLAGYEMNGRQIRNALTTARQLAIFEEETLDWDRLKDSIEVAGDFNRYLKEVHGHTEEQWSRENHIR